MEKTHGKLQIWTVIVRNIGREISVNGEGLDLLPWSLTLECLDPKQPGKTTHMMAHCNDRIKVKAEGFLYQAVNAMVVSHHTPDDPMHSKVLWIKKVDEPICSMNAKERSEYLHRQHGEALQILATLKD